MKRTKTLKTNVHEQFRTLFVDQLRDLYSAESQMISALPNIIRAAKHVDLKEALRDHLQETKKQKTRLEKMFRSLGERPTGKVCEGMKGLIKEGKEIIKKGGAASVVDAALILASQKIEHYEIASYGTLKEFASLLGYDDILELLEDSAKEEAHADKALTSLAEGSWFRSGINIEAAGNKRNDEKKRRALNHKSAVSEWSLWAAAPSKARRKSSKRHASRSHRVKVRTSRSKSRSLAKSR